jgi:uncharacterized membrane protein
MLARWIAVSLIVIVLVVVGVIAGTALFVQVPDATGQSSPAPMLGVGTERVTGTSGPWTVTGELTRGAGNEVTIVIKAENAAGGAVNQDTEIAASLRMLDMAMGEEEVPLTAEGAGQWHGTGRLSMNGRWTLDVTIDGNEIELPFEAVAP